MCDPGLIGSGNSGERYDGAREKLFPWWSPGLSGACREPGDRILARSSVFTLFFHAAPYLIGELKAVNLSSNGTYTSGSTAVVTPKLVLGSGGYWSAHFLCDSSPFRASVPSENLECDHYHRGKDLECYSTTINHYLEPHTTPRGQYIQAPTVKHLVLVLLGNQVYRYEPTTRMIMTAVIVGGLGRERPNSCGLCHK